ncbi:MAG TPA: hypothetical protein VFX85_08710 [Solirubrobacterales bacterium]|nr:hypothetical protein [Solirubrobacterales bacterium]
MRKVKILGIALVAMSSIGASMAVSAPADTLTAQGYPAVLTGQPEEGVKDTLITTVGTLTCAESKYDATITGPVTTAGSLVVTPTYPAGCTNFGFPAPIDTNGCTYVLRVLVAETAGDFDLECPAGQELTITLRSGEVPKCTFHFPAQTDMGGTVRYSNIAGGKLTVEASLTGVDYKHTAGMGLGACASGSGTNGSFSIKAIFSAETEDGKTATSLALSFL